MIKNLVHQRDKNEKREIGIDFLENVQWGTHFCMFYRSRKDIIDLLMPYFAAGLKNNEYCLWIISGPSETDYAKKSLNKVVDLKTVGDQMEFVDYQRWYTPSDVFELDKALQYIAEKEIQVVKDGFDGLRVARNESWIDRSHWDNFDAHEETMEAVIGAHKIIAICIFPIHKCAAGQFVDIVSNHRGGVILSCGKLEVIGPSKGKHGEKRDIFREPMTRRAPRSCFDIYANVIEAASSGALASRLISKGNLNTQRFARIVKTMIDNGLLRTWATSPRIFAATEKGREFLIKYRNLKKMVRIG